MLIAALHCILALAVGTTNNTNNNNTSNSTNNVLIKLPIGLLAVQLALTIAVLGIALTTC